MYNLFTGESEISFPVTKPPGFELIRRTYQREINTIVEYYNNRVFAVRGNHLLCRLLMTSSVPVDYDIPRFMEIVYARAPYVAKHFRFTSAIDYGVFHDGVFYGPDNKELIFYNEDYFNPFEAVQNWKSQRPIKVLSHQISDLGLVLPNGESGSTGKGFCAISINVPMLLCMYRGFLQQQAARFDGEGNTPGLLGVTHFVHMYVLPSMLYSHIDIVLLNRLNNLFRGMEMSRPVRKHAFPVVDYSDKIDNILEEVLERLRDANKSYFWYLQSIPSVFEEDMQVSLTMPDIARTRQAWWALNISRLEVIWFLLTVGGEDGIRSNGALINQLRRVCKYLSREKMLQALLPGSLRADVEKIIGEIMAI